MGDNKLKVKYFFYSFISIFLVIFISNIIKKNQIESFLNIYGKVVKSEYLKNFEYLSKNSELIFLNEFIKSQKISQILKNPEANYREEITSTLIDSYDFYKTLDLKDISFYINNKFLFSFQNNKESFELTKEISKNLDKKESFSSFKMENNLFYIIFSKPIFDDKLNFLGFVNFEFSLDKILTNMELFRDFKTKAIFSSALKSEKRLSFNMNEEEKKSLEIKLNENKDFGLIIKYNLGEYPAYFLPIGTIEKENLYIIAYGTNDNAGITKILKYFDYFLIFMLFVVLLIVFCFYLMSSSNLVKKRVENKYNTLKSQINEYVIYLETDLRGVINYVSEPFCKSTGFSKKELIGKNISILKHLDVSDNFFENMWDSLKKNGIWEGEIKNLDKFGNTTWVKGVIFNRYNQSGKLIGYGSIRVDITDTKQLQKINRLLKEDLSYKLKEIKARDNSLVDTTKVELMSKILDSLSHQWKQPTLKISGELYKLKSKIKNDVIDKEKLSSIHKNIEVELKNLSMMLNEIKYIFNKKEIEKSNLYENILNVKDLLESNLKSQNIKIRLEIENTLFAKIPPSELKNIFINILKNSMEQKEINKQEKLNINIEAFSDENSLILKIEDDLKGEHKNLIDEVFSLDNYDGKFEGNYLYLAKLFIEKNSGLFWCENNKSSTIYYIKIDSLEA